MISNSEIEEAKRLLTLLDMRVQEWQDTGRLTLFTCPLLRNELQRANLINDDSFHRALSAAQMIESAEDKGILLNECPYCTCNQKVSTQTIGSPIKIK